jgi:predicted metal-dependent HD superfamily phosphohydrolase
MAPSYDECLVEAELRARATYSEPHRHYHDVRHLKECLDELDWVHDLKAQQSRLLRWAILWHDSVYEPGRRDNERRSADLAARELSECNVPEPDIEEVVRLIRATEFHRSDPGDYLGRLIVSIDLSILGAVPDRYAEYVADIRLEYAHVQDPMWRTGRSIILERLLECDRIYPDTDFSARLEAQARRNIEAELSQLGGG